jgi:hypothetical protein
VCLNDIKVIGLPRKEARSGRGRGTCTEARHNSVPAECSRALLLRSMRDVGEDLGLEILLPFPNAVTTGLVRRE